MNELLDKYFDQIEIKDADFVPIDNAKSDVAWLYLIIPTKMLREYSTLKNKNKKLPDGAEFWKETGLGEKLRNSDKYHGQGHVCFLTDILDYLDGKVSVNYYKFDSKIMIGFDIAETPEFDDD